MRPSISYIAGMAILLNLACESGGAVVLGVATSPPYMDAARLAIEDEMAAGPVRGLDTLMLSQSQNLAAPAIEAARDLIAREGLVAVIGHSNSAASLAAAPIYNSREVVQIAPTASAPAYSQAGPYSFRLVPVDDAQGQFLAGALAEILPDGGRLALVYVNDDYGRGLRASLLAALDIGRYTIVSELPHLGSGLTEADAAYTATALAATRPDLIVWLARGSALRQSIAGIRVHLPLTPVIGGDGLGTEQMRSVPRAELGNVRYIDYLDLEASDALRAFAARYRERFQRPATVSDALTYDAVRLAITGIRAGARTGEQLRAYLAALGRAAPAYPGMTGPVTFTAEGDTERTYVLLPAGSGHER